jgi:hypothetical protein
MIFLGTIANAGSDVVNNTNTAAPFTIPAWVQTLRLQPSAATQMVSVVLANTPAFAPAATDMLQLGAANSSTDVPLPRRDEPTALLLGALTMAIRKTDAGAGTVKVFAIGRS